MVRILSSPVDFLNLLGLMRTLLISLAGVSAEIIEFDWLFSSIIDKPQGRRLMH